MDKVIFQLNELAIKHHVRKGCGQIAIVNPTQAQLSCIKDICRESVEVKQFVPNKFLTLIDF